MTSEIDIFCQFVSNNPAVKAYIVSVPFYWLHSSKRRYLQELFNVDISCGYSYEDEELIRLYLDNEWTNPIPIKFLLNYKQYLKLQAFQ